MKQNPNYILREIHNIPYLLPIGQLIAEHKKGIQLNDTGAYLWNLLSEERSLEELFDLCSKRFEIPDVEVSQMRSHICQFTNALMQKGLLLTGAPYITTGAPFYKSLKIAGFTIALYGQAAAFSNKLDRFSATCDSVFTSSDNFIIQTLRLCPHKPFTAENGNVLLRSRELCVMECIDKFILFFPTMKQIGEVHLSMDGTDVKVYCAPVYDDTFRENLFHILRHCFLFLAQKHGMFALHSASILYRDKAWLFAGPAGTGKTTHTTLWKEHVRTPILNGDLNLLAIEGGTPVIHGIPWCGTSCICTTDTYPLGGIVLLKQADQNTVTQLSEDQSVLSVCNRLISPVWTSAQLDYNLAFTEKLTDLIMVMRLLCTPNKSSVDMIKEKIDKLYKW